MKIIDVKGLVKRYGDFQALDHLDLYIEQGEILGLLGPNGSGKSTTIHCILSLLNYDHGTVEIFGAPMHPNALDIKRKIGIVPQNIAVFEELNVYENVDYFCGLYVSDKLERVKLVEEALEFVSLLDYRKHMPHQLSGGLLRRLNIACGVAHKPELIILDEPTVAVDPQSRNKILEGIKLMNQQGATILYTTHYMEEVEQLCSRIVIMDKGKQIASGTKESLKGLSLSGERIEFEVYDLTPEFLTSLELLESVQYVTYKLGILTVNCGKGGHNLVNVINHFNEWGVDYVSVRNELPTLNDVFLEITGKALRD